MDPILRWAGSKRKSLDVLTANSPARFDTYYEPFAGSAVLFFRMSSGPAVLGDLNPEVTIAYQAVRDNCFLVQELLTGIPKTREAYYSLRALDPNSLTAYQRGARLIFLMKACFNGVYRTNKLGQFNVPLGSRFYALPTVSHLQEASERLKFTKLHCSDFEETLQSCKANDFVYLDPPYSDSIRFRGEYSYSGAFSVADEDRLVDTCKILTKQNVNVLLSFKWKEGLQKKLIGWRFERVHAQRSVAGFARARGFSEEMLCRNY